MTDLLRSDYDYPKYSVSFTQVLFWLIGRGSFVFTPVFYGSPSKELQNACSNPMQEELEVLYKPFEVRSNVEYVYYLSDLFASIYKDLSLNLSFFDEFVEDLSGYVNNDGTVNDEDFINEFYGLLSGLEEEEEEEENEEIAVKVDIFCDVFLSLFHEDESSEAIDFVYVVTFMSLLLFLIFKDIEEAASLLLSYLVDTSNQKVVPRSSLELFLHCITWLMIEMNVNPQEREGEKGGENGNANASENGSENANEIEIGKENKNENANEIEIEKENEKENENETNGEKETNGENETNDEKREEEEEDFLSNLSISPEIRQQKQKIVENLLNCALLFASPSHFQNPITRKHIEEETEGQDGIHHSVQTLLIEHIFMGIMQRWSYEQLIDCLMQLFQVPNLDALLGDSFLSPYPVEEMVMEAKDVEIEIESVEPVSSNSSDHIQLFSTNSSIGLALHVPFPIEISSPSTCLGNGARITASPRSQPRNFSTVSLPSALRTKLETICSIRSSPSSCKPRSLRSNSRDVIVRCSTFSHTTIRCESTVSNCCSCCSFSARILMLLPIARRSLMFCCSLPAITPKESLHSIRSHERLSLSFTSCFLNC